MNTRPVLLIAAASAAALLVGGCGNDDGQEGPQTVRSPQPSTESTSTGVPPLVPPGPGSAFGAPDGGTAEGTAFTYDEAAVPLGATVDVDSDEEGGRTTVTFSANGLAPNRDFGAHVHTRPCGPQPSDSGPHYQNEMDPAATPDSPSTDPAYANASNEVWLDFTTDANGDAQASSTVDWEFRDGEANSLVIHAHHTMTAPGQAGTAGDRLACVTEDF